MTEEQIVKALECCIAGKECHNCPLRTDDACFQTVRVEALDLINRQKATIDGLINGQETLQKYIAEKDAEIERLQGRNRRLESAFVAECDLSACPRKQEIKNEAIKGFEQNLYSYLGCGHLRPPTEICFSEMLVKQMIERVVKEMVGDGDA